MTTYADHVRWMARCRERPGFGPTAGDTMHRGLGDYWAPGPCPNGMPIDTEPPNANPLWRARIEKAKRDSEMISRYFRVRDRVRTLTMEDVQEFIGEIRAWAQSRKQWPASGWTESTQAVNS